MQTEQRYRFQQSCKFNSCKLVIVSSPLVKILNMISDAAAPPCGGAYKKKTVPSLQGSWVLVPFSLARATLFPAL